MVAIRELGLSHDEVNIHGGAVPWATYWCIGARIVVSLLNVLAKHDLKKGIAIYVSAVGKQLQWRLSEYTRGQDTRRQKTVLMEKDARGRHRHT